MNEIRHIHLGRQAYTIAVDAYKELQDYLEAIRRETGKDVAGEVELRMAELLAERGLTGKKVILDTDVAYLKEQLGTPGDFSDEQSDDEVEVNNAPRRLFRDTDGAMIAGVAAGLAKYLHTDVIIVRLIFVALAFFGGSGVLLYILLWLLVPEAKTNSQRLQMRGLAVNVDNIKEVIAEADVPGATRRVSRLVTKIVGTFVRVVLAIVGIGFVVGGVAVVIASAILTIFGVVRGAQINDSIIFPVGKEELTVLLCGFVVLTLSAVMLAASGVALVRRKWSMSGWAIAAVICAFIVAVSVGTGLGIDAAPNVKARYESLDHHQTQVVQPISRIRIVGTGALYRVARGDKPEVDIHTKGRTDTRGISITEQDGLLTVDTSTFDEHANCSFICPFDGKQTEVTIYAPNVYTIPIEASIDASLSLDNNGVDYTVTQSANGTIDIATPVAPSEPAKPGL